MSHNGSHCSFVLLAEFHILEGAQLKYQFPQPLGIDEGILAASMLPDGAETQTDDWTVFFLNQTPENTIKPVLALDSPGTQSVNLPGEEDNVGGKRLGSGAAGVEGDENGMGNEDLLCVLNLVRTKLDKSEKRGGRTMALAICTRHPFIQIFKPVLLMALDDYLSSDPSQAQDCLARLFDAVNSMDLSYVPKLTRHEKLVMRSSERKDIFYDKFLKMTEGWDSSSSGGFGGGLATATGPVPGQGQGGGKGLQVTGGTHKYNNSQESYTSFDEGIFMRTGGSKSDKDRDEVGAKIRDWDGFGTRTRERADTDSTNASGSQSHQSNRSGGGGTGQYSPSNSSFSLGGSAVWVGDESELNISLSNQGQDPYGTDDPETASVASFAPSSTLVGVGALSIAPSSSTHSINTQIQDRSRRSTDASSSSHSHSAHGHQAGWRDTITPSGFRPSAGSVSIPGGGGGGVGGKGGYNAKLRPGVTKDTHFFHTTVAYKDHQLPIKLPLSTFPEEVGDYSLIHLIKVFSLPQCVTGPHHPHLHTNGPTTHPIIILFNALVTGKRIIFLGHKRPAGEVSSFVLSACALGSGCGAVLRGFVERAFPYASLNNRDEWEKVPAYIAGVTNPIFETSRAWDLLLDISAGTITIAKDIHHTCPITPIPTLSGPGGAAPLLMRTGTLRAEGTEADVSGLAGLIGAGGKDFVAKIDNGTDNLFVDDIKQAIEYHYGESHIRVRFSEYVSRFLRLASRYEEETTGQTRIGYATSPFQEVSSSGLPALGRGLVYHDEALGVKELWANSHKMEAWRKTRSYAYCVADFNKALSSNPIKGFDVLHQLYRLRYAKKMADTETITIMRVLAENTRSYEQCVELLSYLGPHNGGLIQLAYGLFHQKEVIRESTVDLFDHLRQFPVGVVFLQALNHFQRYAYVRQAHAREMKALLQQQKQAQTQEEQFALSQSQPPPGQAAHPGLQRMQSSQSLANFSYPGAAIGSASQGGGGGVGGGSQIIGRSYSNSIIGGGIGSGMGVQPPVLGYVNGNS